MELVTGPRACEAGRWRLYRMAGCDFKRSRREIGPAVVLGSAPCASRCSRRTATRAGFCSKATARVASTARPSKAHGSGRSRSRGPRRICGPRSALEDRLHRPELRGARERARQRVPKEPLLFFKPPSVGDRPRRSGGPAEGERSASSTRPSLGSSSAARVRRVSREQAMSAVYGYTVRLRRHRARSSEEGRAVGAREGLRHVLPGWAVDRDRARSGRPRGEVHRRRRHVRQSGRTSQMIFDIPTLIAYVSRGDDARAGRSARHGSNGDGHVPVVPRSAYARA